MKRGFTMIETCFALAILVIVLGAACMVIASARRHSALQWEELAAREFAVSVLEHAEAPKTCELTGVEGRKIGTRAGDAVAPPGFEATLFTTPNAADKTLVDARVVITWRRELANGIDDEGRVERSLRRRAQR